MKYLVIEIQKFDNGAISTPTYAYDNESSALAKYYSILSSAAISKLPTHSCVLMTEEGFQLRKECFKHAPEPTPEPTPEPEPEPIEETEGGGE